MRPNAPAEGAKPISGSPIVKRSLKIAGHKTAVSLEDAFWHSAKEIAALKQIPLRRLIEQIDDSRNHGNLSSAIRLFVLDYYRSDSKGSPNT